MFFEYDVYILITFLRLFFNGSLFYISKKTPVTLVAGVFVYYLILCFN